MQFQRVATEDAEGAIVAHAVRLPGLTLKNGEIVDARAVTELRCARVTEIVVARLEPGDTDRNAAAGRLAEKIAGVHVRLGAAFTGRGNLFSTFSVAIELAGGSVDHLRMPVDPGNLLLLGEFSGRPVIGAPGCARSMKENGFDFVLYRLLAGLTVSSTDIRRMGVGGLLMEIPSRPQPRAGFEALSAAKASSRLREPTKRMRIRVRPNPFRSVTLDYDGARRAVRRSKSSRVSQSTTNTSDSKPTAATSWGSVSISLRQPSFNSPVTADAICLAEKMIGLPRIP